MTDPARGLTFAKQIAYTRSAPYPLGCNMAFYIGPDGRILDIDKSVKAATAGEDMVAKLTALGVKKRM